MATGGEAVAHLDDGRVIFVQGALADEVVQVVITEEKKRFARGQVIDVVEASPMRIEPSCAHAGSGDCGGCDWIHIKPGAQRSYKNRIVVEQLQRLGGIESPVVTTADLPRGRRTTVRCSVISGRAGYRRRRSDESFAALQCGAVHGRIESLIVEGRFGNATEVTLRAGSATGDRMVVTNGDVHTVSVPDDVLVVSVDEPGDAFITEELGGKRWRVSAGSFFQTSYEGAKALVAAVAAGLEDSEGEVVDLYAGVGLLGGAAATERLAGAVESNPSSVADARHNLGSGVRIAQKRVEHWKPLPFETVIADPARRGLGKGGAAVIDKTGASRLVLVSCDPASLGRDAALLGEQGWHHDRGEVIDMFPDTSRVEVVSTFSR